MKYYVIRVKRLADRTINKGLPLSFGVTSTVNTFHLVYLSQNYRLCNFDDSATFITLDEAKSFLKVAKDLIAKSNRYHYRIFIEERYV